MNELDEILLEQLHVARRINKKIKRAKKLMKHDHLVYQMEEYNEKKIRYFEYMIQDKTLLHKKVKRKKKKNKDLDILARSTAHEWYRNFMVVTNIGYKLMTDSFQAYMSFFTNKKGKG